MKVIFLTLVSVFGLISCSAQKFDLIDVKNVAATLNWKPAKNLKDLSAENLNLFFLKANSDYQLVQQINIEGWAICEHRKTDNLSLYNYYYADITRNTYDMYCSEINVLMLLDGIIKQ